MIYEIPEETDPIRQGDIFISVPRIELSLEKILLAGTIDYQETSWANISKRGSAAEIIVSVRSVPAIVTTQDCDALRSRDITLCEIREFRDVERKSQDTKSPKSWKNLITQHARINQKWFYLPPDAQMGFSEKMAVDFMVTLRVPRTDLEGLRDFRRGRLNSIADEHFRERLGEFYRRYPYDEWYPLNPEEFAEYKGEYEDVTPFPWQATSAAGSS